MSLTSSLAIYVIIWWLVIFMVLPFGAKAKINAHDIEEGQDPGAPAKPMIIRKLLITTVISLIFFGMFYFAYEAGMLDFRPVETTE